MKPIIYTLMFLFLMNCIDTKLVEADGSNTKSPAYVMYILNWPVSKLFPQSSSGSGTVIETTPEITYTQLAAYDFSNGIIPNGWTGGWTATSTGCPVTGTPPCLRSGGIADNQSSSLTFTTTLKVSKISFKRRISSESGYDICKFTIDGADVVEEGVGVSGTDDKLYEFTFSEATSRTFAWTYRKDSGSFVGLDLCSLDDVTLYGFTGTGTDTTGTGSGTGTGTTAQVCTVSTFAGSGSAGSTDGTGTAASFNQPSALAVDSNKNIYIADTGNNKIRKISSVGVVTTLAGSGSAGSTNATGAAASFNGPYGVAVDNSGFIFVADSNNNKIRGISSAGVVTDYAGSGAIGISVNSTGIIYVTAGDKIRKIFSGTVTTLVALPDVYSPLGITVDSNGIIYTTDYYDIKKISSTGVVTHYAGAGYNGSTDGPGASAAIFQPRGIAADNVGNLYIADTNYHKIRKISTSVIVTTLAGSNISGSADGIGTAASFNSPYGVVVDSSGTLYVADRSNNKIRKIVCQ